jgi:signal transduction histidine kinase
MIGLAVLRGTRSLPSNPPFDDAEPFHDAQALLERIRGCPGAISWVAIAPDFKDAVAVAQDIRAADSSVGVILLGDEAAPADALPPALSPGVLGATVDSSASASALAAQRRTLEADKLASITALTAEITHEIGTPMTAILGYAELLAKSVGDEKNRKRATTIVDQVARVRDLIGTLMSLSRMDERSPLPLELTGILDKTLDLYREKFKRRGIEIERHYGPAPRVLGDPGRLHQVLLGLFLHALKAISEGGVLRVSLAEIDTTEVEIRISGTGWDIDPDLRARIFEPGFSTKQRAGGPGLGLFVAKTLIEEQGGKMALTNEPDRGTEFRLIFPQPRPA